MYSREHVPANSILGELWQVWGVLCYFVTLLLAYLLLRSSDQHMSGVFWSFPHYQILSEHIGPPIEWALVCYSDWGWDALLQIR